MDEIKPYRKYIGKYFPLLEEQSFSLLNEDDNSVEITDGEVFITFSVEPHSDDLEVWIEFLSETSTDKRYRLDVIMKIEGQDESKNLFREKPNTEEKKDNLVKSYVEFVVQNKTKLFGELFPLAFEYDEYQRSETQKLLERFEKPTTETNKNQ